SLSHSSLHSPRAHRHLLSFPTRRSSDLVAYGSNQRWASLLAIQPNEPNNITAQCYYWRAQYSQNPGKALKAVPDLWLSGESRPRSEEHTSELQSRFDLVCRLLLEKKKKS